jgi:hypothetical protein
VRVVKAQALSAGPGHACAVSSVGHYKCWGTNANKRLGLTDTTVSSVADPSTRLWVPGWSGRKVAQVSAGFDHTCLRLIDGTAACWGDNTTGELGIGNANTTGVTTANAATAIGLGLDAQGRPLTFEDIQAGANMTCGVRSDGKAVCWGGNSAGQLGIGSTVDQTLPQVVAFRAGGSSTGAVLPNRVSNVSLGHNAVQPYACAVLDDGSGWCWGHNGDTGSTPDNRLGGATANSSVPFPVSHKPAGAKFRRIVTGFGHACALIDVPGDDDGAACFGERYGGSYPDTATVLFTPATHVSAGSFMSGVVTNGSLKAWGYGANKSLGTGTTNADWSGPLSPTLNLGTATISAIVSNVTHDGWNYGSTTFVLRSDGRVQCFGANSEGECGIGSSGSTVVAFTKL